MLSANKVRYRAHDEEYWSSYLAATTDTDQEEMALHLPEDTVDTQYVVQDVVEQHKGYIKFFFVEDAQPGLRVLPEGLTFN